MPWIIQVGDASPADHLARIVDGVRAAAGTRGVGDSQRAQQLHFPVVVEAIAVQVDPDKAPPTVAGRPKEGDPAKRAAFIDVVSFAAIPAVERRDVDELVGAPEKSMGIGAVGEQRPARHFAPFVDAPRHAARAAERAEVL